MKLTLNVGILLLLHLVLARESVFENSTSLCVDVPAVPAQDQCQFVNSYCDTSEYNIGAFDYLSTFYCSPLRAIPTVLFGGVIVGCFVSLAVTASNYLCPNLYSISKFLELSDNLAGLTLLALGNGSADVVSTFEALEVGATGLAVSELLGAAFFILTAVVGAVSIASPFKVPRMEFLRDSIFYILVLLVVLCSLLMGQFNYYNSALLVLIYIGYVLVVIYSHSILVDKHFLNLNLSRLRSHYDEALGEQLDPVPEISQPSIDTLASHADLEEYEAFIKSVGDSDLQVPIETGSYGLKVLLKGLSKHTTQHAQPHSPIHLTNERQLNAESPIEEDPEETVETELVHYKDIWRSFIPVCEKDAPFYSKIMYVLSFPANVALKLTTPNREDAINHMHTYRSNSFNFDSLDEHTAGGNCDLLTENEFISDLRVYKIQFVVAPLWLIIRYLHSDSLFLLYVLVVLALFTPISLLAPEEVPKEGWHSRLFMTYNYFGSFLGFVLSISWISMFATEIVAVLKASAVVLRLSDEIIGATVFAWGNSVGDLISNLMIARMGMPLMAFGACFGGPLLAICSLGACSMIIMNQFGSHKIPVKFSSSLKINCFSLILALACLLVGVPRNSWTFDRKIGVILIGVWVFSVTAIVTVERLQ